MAAHLTTVTVERSVALQFGAGSGDPGPLSDFFPLLFFPPPFLLLPQDFLERLSGVQHLRMEVKWDSMGIFFSSKSPRKVSCHRAYYTVIPV